MSEREIIIEMRKGEREIKEKQDNEVEKRDRENKRSIGINRKKRRGIPV